MPKSEWSTKKVQETYDSLRKRYFLNGPNIPANKLRWSWLSEASTLLAATCFDADDDPESMELNLVLRKLPTLMRVTLLHELTHIRLGPDVPCPSLTKKRVPDAWKRETVRLASLGAPLL
jgi:hypothetical protein